MVQCEARMKSKETNWNKHKAQGRGREFRGRSPRTLAKFLIFK